MSEVAVRQRAEQIASTLPPLLVAAERVATTVAQGVHGRRRVGSGETFWQFRRYEHGDAASVIDWRQSAKSERLFVRQHEWEAAQSVWLWRDASPSMRYRSRFADTEKEERATLLLLAVAALLVRGGERIALLGQHGVPATGGAALTRLAEAMTQAPGRGEGASTPPDVRLPRYSHLVLVSDFLSPVAEFEAIVKRHAEAGVAGHLLQIVDPAEEDLPFKGRAEFRGTEGEGLMVVGRVETLRGAYGRRIAARREALQRLTGAAGWTFATHRTDAPPQTALLALYQALADGLA